MITDLIMMYPSESAVLITIMVLVLSGVLVIKKGIEIEYMEDDELPWDEDIVYECTCRFHDCCEQFITGGILCCKADKGCVFQERLKYGNDKND